MNDRERRDQHPAHDVRRQAGDADAVERRINMPQHQENPCREGGRPYMTVNDFLKGRALLYRPLD